MFSTQKTAALAAACRQFKDKHPGASSAQIYKILKINERPKELGVDPAALLPEIHVILNKTEELDILVKARVIGPRRLGQRPYKV